MRLLIGEGGTDRRDALDQGRGPNHHGGDGLVAPGISAHCRRGRAVVPDVNLMQRYPPSRPSCQRGAALNGQPGRV